MADPPRPRGPRLGSGRGAGQTGERIVISESGSVPGAPPVLGVKVRSPFSIGFSGALGVGAAFLLGWVAYSVRAVLILLLLALFTAVGFDSAARWLQTKKVPRAVALLIVILAALAVVGGFLALAVPVLVTQITSLANHIPGYLSSLKNKHTFLGKINNQYHIVKYLQQLLNTKGSALRGGLIGVGKAVFSLITDLIIVAVVTVYLLIDFDRVKRGFYNLISPARRPRVVRLTEGTFTRVGGYVLGNLLTSLIAGLGTWIWALALGIPYSVLLGVLVALLDLIPIVGSSLGGLVVALVALTVSLPVAIATLAFYVGYRFLEDYLLTPQIIGRTVNVPGLATVIATIIGGSLLGIIGALLAVPVAAAVLLIIDDVISLRDASANGEGAP
ncbi:MAG: AI-2E family transporter [Acidimicrobiales bacterium]